MLSPGLVPNGAQMLYYIRISKEKGRDCGILTTSVT